jgi:hypothetical protein
MLGSSWVAAQLAVSQEGLGSMSEWVMTTTMCVAVVMHKDKEDGLHHEAQFRNRDLTTYDHTLLDGEMFLQVCTVTPCPEGHIRCTSVTQNLRYLPQRKPTNTCPCFCSFLAWMFYSEDGGNILFRNVWLFQNYMAFQPRRHHCENPEFKNIFYLWKRNSSCYGLQGPPLWSSGQSSWLQIQKVRVRFPALPFFLRSSGCGATCKK